MREYTREHYQRPLTERWNVCMTYAGFVGSEFIDEPEYIANKIRKMKDDLMEARKELVIANRKIRELQGD